MPGRRAAIRRTGCPAAGADISDVQRDLYRGQPSANSASNQFPPGAARTPPPSVTEVQSTLIQRPSAC
jgi:hypothetical protein